jgi:hypothetical protein
MQTQFSLLKQTVLDVVEVHIEKGNPRMREAARLMREIVQKEADPQRSAKRLSVRGRR